MKYLPADKAVLTGSPIRRELLNGSPLAGYQFTGFSSEKPVLLIIGGSLGSVKVNQAVRSILPELLKTWQVVHLCGKGNLDLSLDSLDGYVQYEYISSELKDLFAMSDLMISRAGANSICEILALRKPNILIPLSAAASRGDQILNANSFKKQGFSEVIQEEELTDTALLSLINQVYSHRQDYIHAMNKSKTADAIGTIVQLIEEAGGRLKRRLDFFCQRRQFFLSRISGLPVYHIRSAFIPGNHMHVKMEYGLSCCQSVVLYQVEAVTL